MLELMKYCLIFNGLCVNLDKDRHQIPSTNYQIPMAKTLVPSPLVGEGEGEGLVIRKLVIWNLFGI